MDRVISIREWDGNPSHSGEVKKTVIRESELLVWLENNVSLNDGVEVKREGKKFVLNHVW